MPTHSTDIHDENLPTYDRRDWLTDEAEEKKHKDFAAQILQTTAPFAECPASQLHVLDVGSGYGGTVLELARICREVVGVEPSAKRVHEARQLQARHSLTNVRFQCCSVYDLSDTEAYDLVVLDNVLEHLPDQRLALTIVSRALKRGGVLYILVPNKLWPIEVHYRLPLLSYMPVGLANCYLRITGRGTDYRDASYAPTYFRLYRLLRERDELSYQFVLPANVELTAGGRSWHYRWGVKAIRRCPWLWTVSKAFLVVAKKKNEVATDTSFGGVA